MSDDESTIPDHVLAPVEATPSQALPFPVPTGLDAASLKLLIDLFLAGRSPSTLANYNAALLDFTAFLHASSLPDAARALLSHGQGAANATVLAYRKALVERKLAAATVNLRLCAVRALVKLARIVGLVPWTVEVPNLKDEPYRDTRGPGHDGVVKLLEKARERQDRKGARDFAVLRLLYDLALRRAEVVSLELEHLDVKTGTLAVLGKRRTSRTKLTLPDKTRAALEAWLALRGSGPGPLFLSCDPAEKAEGLSASGVYRIVRGLGERIEIRARPHGLRHAAITEGLDRTDGNVRAVQKFGRHEDPRVTITYDDARRDLAGEVARLVAESA